MLGCEHSTCVCLQGVVHHAQAGMLLGCLEVMIEDVIDDMSGWLSLAALRRHIMALQITCIA